MEYLFVYTCLFHNTLNIPWKAKPAGVYLDDCFV